MSANTEKGLQKKLGEACKRYGVLCYKFASPSKRGVPDLILINEGRVVFVELKSPTGNGRLSELQKLEIKTLREHGATVFVVDNEIQFNKIFEALGC